MKKILFSLKLALITIVMSSSAYFAHGAAGINIFAVEPTYLIRTSNNASYYGYDISTACIISKLPDEKCGLLLNNCGRKDKKVFVINRWGIEIAKAVNAGYRLDVMSYVEMGDEKNSKMFCQMQQRPKK